MCWPFDYKGSCVTSFDRARLAWVLTIFLKDSLINPGISSHGLHDQEDFLCDMSPSLKRLLRRLAKKIPPVLRQNDEIQLLQEGGKWLKDFVTRRGVDALNALMIGQPVPELVAESRTSLQESVLEEKSERDV
jgi:hypothetical protein